MHRLLSRSLIMGLLAGILGLGFWLVAPGRADSPEDVDKLNKKIDSFTLEDGSGKPWSLAAHKDKKAVVVLFLSFDCPVSNSYAPTLSELHRKYHDKGVEFVAINASDDLSPAELLKQAKEYRLPFPMLKDDRFKAADAFKAKIAPEAFVLDHNHILRYRGRIDNAYSARLKKNPRTTSYDLDAALAEVLAGKAVRTPATKAIGCHILRERTPAQGGKVTYYRDVMPILQTHCQQCHRPGEVGPFSLMTYKQAVNWAQDIKDYTQERKMPPWKVVEGGPFHNDRRLSEAELLTIKTWVDNGTPEGDPRHAPAPKEFTEGWQLGKPDLILTMPEELTLGPSGKDLFRCVVLPTGLTEDKFVTAVEVRPGNPRVVHHSLNFFDTTGTARALEKKERERKKRDDEQDHGPGYSVGMGVGFIPTPGKFGGVGGWAPGQRARFLPEGYGWPLPKGSDIVMQLHYHRNGKTEKDRTSIGLYFAKKPGIKPYKSAIIPGRFPLLGIPPGSEKYPVTGSIEMLEDGELHSVMHHMHMLGRKAKVTMTTPEGITKTLLRIDDWDYNWQETYYLKDPISFRAGTKFAVEVIYDNSANNPSNPFHPPRRIFFGEQTDSEMCFVFLGVTSDASSGRFRFKPEGGTRAPLLIPRPESTEQKKEEQKQKPKDG